MKILDFKMLPHDGILEARIEHGYYHILEGDNGGFNVQFVIGHNYHHIGNFPDIYAALDAANKNYNTAPPIIDRQMGAFKRHVYLVTGRYPLDTGENYTSEDINSMFKLTYPAGTELYLDKEDNCWYLEKDGDGGWGADSEFAKKNIEKLNGKLN
jgi:hypothetical protein